MRLTKIEALRLTAELWGWLAEDGQRRKMDWPKWKQYPPPYNHCFLCEYAGQRQRNTDKQICYFCPLRGKWGAANLCSWEGSPYRTWEGAQYPGNCVWDGAQYPGNFERATQAAAQIAQLCQQELARLTKGKGR